MDYIHLITSQQLQVSRTIWNITEMAIFYILHLAQIMLLMLFVWTFFYLDSFLPRPALFPSFVSLLLIWLDDWYDFSNYYQRDCWVSFIVSLTCPTMVSSPMVFLVVKNVSTCDHNRYFWNRLVRHPHRRTTKSPRLFIMSMQLCFGWVYSKIFVLGSLEVFFIYVSFSARPQNTSLCFLLSSLV